MPTITFLPTKIKVKVDEKTKILVAALKNKIPIRYGCGACQCGTCAVEVKGAGHHLEAMLLDEKALLERMGLKVDGSQRLACRAKILSGELEVDLDFQESYSPDKST